jgi:hypothetical protein
MRSFRADTLLLGWLALAGSQVVAGLLIPVKFPSVPYALEWMLLADLVIAGVLTLIAVRSDWTGWKLAGVLTLMPFAINLVNMLEGTFFLKNAGIDWRTLTLLLCVSYVLVFPLWRYIFARGPAGTGRESPLKNKFIAGFLWRFVVSDFAYLILYFAAGMIIFPYVRDFYATQSLPSGRTIMALQLGLRGPVFVLICILLVHLIGMRRWPGALVVGLAFTMLSGVAPLLAPNPYFPDAVRWVHFGEVVSSNFVFGTVVGWTWGGPEPRSASGTIHQAA